MSLFFALFHVFKFLYRKQWKQLFMVKWHFCDKKWKCDMKTNNGNRNQKCPNLLTTSNCIFFVKSFSFCTSLWSECFRTFTCYGRLCSSTKLLQSCFVLQSYHYLLFCLIFTVVCLQFNISHIKRQNMKCLFFICNSKDYAFVRCTTSGILPFVQS